MLWVSKFKWWTWKETKSWRTINKKLTNKKREKFINDKWEKLTNDKQKELKNDERMKHTCAVRGAGSEYKTWVTIHFLRRSNCWVTSPREGGSDRGSSLAAVMIHVWTKQVHVTYLRWSYAKHLPANTWTCWSVKWTLAGLHWSRVSIN